MLAQALPLAAVESAGLGALVGKPAASEMQHSAKVYGIDLSAHRGRQLFQPHLEAADIVIVMEKNQRDHLQEKYPHMFGRIFLLSHFSSGDLKGQEVADPYRKSQAVFDQCAKEIAGHVESLAKTLAPMIREVTV